MPYFTAAVDLRSKDMGQVVDKMGAALLNVMLVELSESTQAACWSMV